MGWESHFVTGALAGYVVTNSFVGALVGGVAGLVPDIDEPNAKLGRYVPFFSRWLKHTFGHRTLTHSLLFFAAIGMALYYFDVDEHYTYAVLAGLMAHSACDMITGRVQLFYPLPMKVGIRVKRKWSKRIDEAAKWLALGAFIALVLRNIVIG